jgi:hypothetical protein
MVTPPRNAGTGGKTTMPSAPASTSLRDRSVAARVFVTLKPASSAHAPAIVALQRRTFSSCSLSSSELTSPTAMLMAIAAGRALGDLRDVAVRRFPIDGAVLRERLHGRGDDAGRQLRGHEASFRRRHDPPAMARSYRTARPLRGGPNDDHVGAPPAISPIAHGG